MTTYQDAMLHPGACFKNPRDVLTEAWSPDQKYQVLRQWKYDIGQLHLATEENMPPAQSKPDQVSLRQLHEAMEALGYAADADPVPSKGS